MLPVLRVVMFAGGRGSAVLTRQLIARPDVRLTLAVNGYDDGASTGEVRRFLGDALGPSDFRKNASLVAAALATCSPGLVHLLDSRLPEAVTGEQATAWLEAFEAGAPGSLLAGAHGALTPAERTGVSTRLDAFVTGYRERAVAFEFGDCAVGNLVFAGSYLLCDRRFNAAVDDYCGLVGLPPGVVENVTDGTNAYLVALDVDGRVLGTEADIVDSRRANRIADIFLIDQPLSADQCTSLGAGGAEAARRFFDDHARPVRLNPRLGPRLDEADLIVYAPGTQHSSLFPSYLTAGLSDRIAGNVHAVKLLVTNLQSDAEIAGASAVSLVERARFFLTDKGRRQIPEPFLITHYVLNDPQRPTGLPYVPLGQVDMLEDPRLVRIGDYEDAVTGRHDADKVLEPFVQALLAPPVRPRVGVLLYGTTSPDKLAQTLLEIVRAGEPLAADLTVYAASAGGLEPHLLDRLPFAVTLSPDGQAAEQALRAAAAGGAIDYVGLFDSSGMYRGEDLAGLLRYLGAQRLDAVWGSRRLSVRDIEASFRYYDSRSAVEKAISRVGSHLLSFAYLVLYGRYVADTLSGVRIVRARYATALRTPVTHELANQRLLTGLLRARGDLLEVPVRFIPLSRTRVKRTGILDGLRSLWTIVWGRLAGGAGAEPAPPAR
jgi:2-phospho-L-lactate transferase/gluconeogenesis factor (CofD/UPF0052 family)